MKKLFFCIFLTLVGVSCRAQQGNSIEDSITNLHPSIYYYLCNDGDTPSDELVLLFPDSTFYYEASAPMMLQYTRGKYTCHEDSLFLTSCQVLDTLAILDVDEYCNFSTDTQATIIVVDERNHFQYSRFIINGRDTLVSDTNYILQYNGAVKEIQVSVEDMRRYSRYTVRSTYKNFFIIQVDSEKKLALALGPVRLFENRPFVKKVQSLYDPLNKRELHLQTTIPQGTELTPFLRQ